MCYIKYAKLSMHTYKRYKYVQEMKGKPTYNNFEW